MINHRWLLTLLPEWSKSYLFSLSYLYTHIFTCIPTFSSISFIVQGLMLMFLFYFELIYFLAKWEIRSKFLDKFSQHHLLKFSLWCAFLALLWYLYLHLLFYSKTHVSVFMQVSCFYYYDSVVYLEIKYDDTSINSLFFIISLSFHRWILRFFYLCEKYHCNFHLYCLDSVDCFFQSWKSFPSCSKSFVISFFSLLKFSL